MDCIEHAQKLDFALTGIARAVESVLRQEFGDKIGFALVVFEFGESETGNYISNADRLDMIKVLRATADRLEKRQDIPPAASSMIQ